jgi:hypothetical protein
MANFDAEMYGLLGGILPWSSGLHLSGAIVEGTLATDWDDAVQNLFDTTTNGLKNFMSADVTLTGTSVSTLNSVMRQTTKTVNADSIAGIDANASLPWNIAEVITTRSAQYTKSGHGRMFMPPFAEDQIVAHVIKSATIASMVIVFDAFFAALTGAGATPFIFNERTKKDGTPPYTVTDLTHYDVSNKPAQQRRRVSKLVPTRTTGTF